MKKRLLSTLLAAIMLLSTLTVGAFADGLNINVIHVDNNTGFQIPLDRSIEPVWKSSDPEVLSIVKTGVAKISFGSSVKVIYSAEVQGNKAGEAKLTLSDAATDKVVGTATVQVIKHRFTETTVVPATCVDEGYTRHTCSCGKYFKDSITQPTGVHTAEPVPAVAATCTNDGLTEGSRCSVCGTVLTAQEPTPALGHDYKAGTMRYREPNGHSHGYVNDDGPHVGDCLLPRYRVHECTRCHISYDENFPALGHNYGSGVVTAEPTYTSNGEKTYTCSVCLETKTEVIPMLDPAAPNAKITTSSGKPKISWNAVEGAEKYEVYRSIDGVNYSLLISTSKTSVTNTGAKIGTTYYYKVRAINAAGNSSEFSAVKSMKCRPAAPTITMTRVSGKPKLSWNAVTGATKYYVYRSTDGVNYKYLTYTTKLSYTNTSVKVGTKYYYKVKAVASVNGTNVGSAYSNAKSLLVSTAAPRVKITTASGKPKISWNKVDGATKYYIYRSTDGVNFSYQYSTTKTSYTNTSAKKGTKYYYKVKAVKVVNGTNVTSAYSNTVSIKATK